MTNDNETAPAPSGNMATYRLRGANHHILCLLEDYFLQQCEPSVRAKKLGFTLMRAPEFWRM
ncbi:hypothetical protein [Aestuariispira insulae]|uniref:Uncharacterized protein n=1 Tax=Aestuariispira insulae TaxID=1461337 RepID=A0A3D9HWA0_9PROT|nr:hypothetical protein [Aestuariispira insulae]RED53794.1 hypothetical protein DFP90_101593 [Aestuariispira insulae]